MDCWRLQLRRWALGKALQLETGAAKVEKPRHAKCKAAGDFIAMNVAASRRTIVSLFHLGFVAFVVLENGSLIDVEPVGEIDVGADAAHIVESIQGIQQL